MTRRKKNNTGRQILLRFAFLLYAAAMIWLLFGQRWGTQNHLEKTAAAINLTPFATIKLYWWILQNGQSRDLLIHAFVNLAGNVVMFIPLGFYVPYLMKGMRNFFKAMFLLVVLILTVETVQYFTYLGSCDIDDVILNVAGVLMGYLIWVCGRKKKHK